MFHGNGGNHGHRIPLASIFVMKMRCNVLMMCYRGCVHVVSFTGVYWSWIPSSKLWSLRRFSFGERYAHILLVIYAISDSYQGLRIDAQTGLDYITSHPLFKDTPLVSAVPFHLALLELQLTVHIKVLYGQSIGGAVAIDLASRNSAKVVLWRVSDLGFWSWHSKTDKCVDTWKYVHLSSQFGTTRTSSSRPFIFFVSPEMGFGIQNPTYPCNNAYTHAQRCQRWDRA